MKAYYYIGVLIFLLLACKKESFQDPQDFGYNYQAKRVGYWLEYEVDSIYYDDVGSPSTIYSYHYYIKELMESTFMDAAGKENIRIEVYKKYNEGDLWVLNEVGSVVIDDNSYQRYFNDLRFVNLVFPVRENKEWQGHAYIDNFGEASLEYLDDDKYDWSFEYTAVDTPLSFDYFDFDSCAVVLQIDDENLFEKKYSKEVYARAVGLVYKEMMVLNTQLPPSGLSFIDRAESGFILKYRLIDYLH